MTEPAQNESKSTPPARRFAVQPMETSTKSNRTSKPKADNSDTNGPAPRRRLAPQLEESTERSHRKSGKFNVPRENGGPEKEKEAPSSSTPGGSVTRKFSPQLVDTAKRTRKKGDTLPAMRHTDKTDLSPGDKVHLPRHVRLVEFSGSQEAIGHVQLQRGDRIDMHPPESRFSYANLSKKTPRQASFRVPQLEPIASPDDSEGSNDSNAPSLSTTPSAISDIGEAQKKARRLRESCDEKFNGYLLALAARAAEKQLQDQALAAFPNERFYEPVNHFAFKRNGEDSDEEDSAVISESFDVADAMQRRMSAAGWDVAEMQQHQEKLVEEREQKRKLADASKNKARPQKDPWENPYNLQALHGPEQGHDREHIGGAVRDPDELSKMRSAASPPLLGEDLEFAQSQSPQQTMIDATQKPRSRTRRFDEPASRQHSGLWTPGGGASPSVTRKNSVSPSASASMCSPALWGGHCGTSTATGPDKNLLCVPRSPLQTGIMTPHPEPAEGVEESSVTIYHEPSSSRMLPPNPCSTGFGSDVPSPLALANIDSVLTLESSLDTSYPDAFVTQVYNYLSLGYPALAQKYDTELSKISRVSVDEIRRGDREGRNTKGVVGAPEGDGWEEKEIREKCGRWWALRLYVKEWARQQPRMREGGRAAVVGVGPGGGRRGSWGN